MLAALAARERHLSSSLLRNSRIAGQLKGEAGLNSFSVPALPCIVYSHDTLDLKSLFVLAVLAVLPERQCKQHGWVGSW